MYITQRIEEIKVLLEKEKIKATIYGRPKTFYSIYKKTKKNKLIENKEDIATICNWINPISGYRINSAYATTGYAYGIKFYSSNNAVLTISLTSKDFRIVSENPRKTKYYSLGANYYDELTELLSRLNK